MDAKELRIGNYVYAQSGKLVVNRDSIYKVENVNIQSARKYEPIPLTEEWMLKFGFEESYWQASGKFAHWIKDGADWFDGDLNCIVYYRVTEIKYVHQLQNLYFALTGEELT